MTTLNAHVRRDPTTGQWAVLGIVAAILAAAAVLAVQAIALSVWPEAALFKPLESYPRSAVFTIIPAFVATALFAWLAGRRRDPVRTFLGISAIVFLLSLIPDYILPVPNKSWLASTIAAFLHMVAALVIVSVLVIGYRRYSGRA